MDGSRIVLVFILAVVRESIGQACDGGEAGSYRVTSDGVVEHCFFIWQPVCYSSHWEETESAVACHQVGTCVEDEICESEIIPEVAPPSGIVDSAVSCQGDEPTLNECDNAVSVTCIKNANNEDQIVKVTCQVPENPCPDDWIHLEETGKCYKFIDQEVNWFMAYKQCLLEVKGNSNLWTIDSNSELEFVRSHVLTGFAQYDTFWMGGNDISRNNKWRNVPKDNKAAFYKASSRFGWAENEPSDMDDALFERCGALIGDVIPSRNYYIHDENCGVLGIPICQMQY